MGIIYEIVDLTTGERYIGSTVKNKERRLIEHISSYKSFKNGKGNFVTSFIIIEKNNYEIRLLEETNDLVEREGFYIKKMECVNKNIVGRTLKEYNKEKYEINKVKILEQQKKKYNCICGSIINRNGKSRHERTTKHLSNVHII